MIFSFAWKALEVLKEAILWVSQQYHWFVLCIPGKHFHKTDEVKWKKKSTLSGDTSKFQAGLDLKKSNNNIFFTQQSGAKIS